MSAEIIVALITGITSVVSVIIANWIGRREDRKLLLRCCIQETYFSYLKDRIIPQVVYAGVCEMYDKYISYGGNSYIKTMKAEMDKWERN